VEVTKRQTKRKIRSGESKSSRGKERRRNTQNVEWKEIDEKRRFFS
jgi:hypothetical protein